MPFKCLFALPLILSVLVGVNILQAQQLGDFALQKEAYAAKHVKAIQRSEALRRKETPHFDKFRVEVFTRYLGFDGEDRAASQNTWNGTSQLAQALLENQNDNSSLMMVREGEERDMLLAVSKKRGYTTFSDMEFTVRLIWGYNKGGEGDELFSLTFELDSDMPYDEEAVEVLRRLNIEVSKRPEQFQALKTILEQRKAFIAKEQKQKHQNKRVIMMVEVRGAIEKGDYARALEGVEYLQKGLIVDDSLEYLRAILLTKQLRLIEAKRQLKLMIDAPLGEPSKYTQKAKWLLHKLEVQ